MKKSINWRAILLEAFLVVMGVALAFAANEWRQHRNDIARGEEALANIYREMMVNRNAVESSFHYHRSLTDSLYQAIRQSPDRKPKVNMRIFDRGYIAPAAVLNTAWEVANATDASSHINYETLISISNIYERQEHYEKQADMAGALIYETLFNKGYEGISSNLNNLTNILSTFWYRECELLEEYTVFLIDAEQLEPATLDSVKTFCSF